MKVISTNKAPSAIGPYSQAIIIGSFVFTSGQIALKPDGEFLDDDIQNQTKQVLNNLKEVLIASGSSFEKIIKTTIFLTDMNDFSIVNEIYGSYFQSNKPARSTIAVMSLPKNAKIEIEAVASI